MTIILVVAALCLMALAVVFGVRLGAARAHGRALEQSLDEAKGQIAASDEALKKAVEDIAAVREAKVALEAQMAAREEARQTIDREREEALRRQEAERAEAQRRQEAERAEAQRRQEAERAEERKRLDEERDKAASESRRQRADDMESLKNAFKALAAENSDVFRRKSSEDLGKILKPIQDKFAEFDKSFKEGQIKSGEQSASMRTLIEQVMQQSKSVGEEARNLANALTGYSKVQGDFGEMLLTDLLKSSGLTEGVHFVTQAVIQDDRGHEVRSEQGRTMIPDVIVFYPDDTLVIIDSKVSLTAYNNYMSAEGIEDRKRLAREHAASVRAHVDELKRKNYASYIPEGKSKVDYNIMFIPMEGAFQLVLEEDPRLWQLAKDNGVLIVSQMTLIIVLNMIQMSWRQHDQEKNIADVYKTAGELMSQINAWLDAFVKVGENLDKAGRAYSEARQKLLDSPQAVVRKIDKLERLGLAPRKSAARIKTGARMVMGRESVIPKELSEGLDAERDQDAGPSAPGEASEDPTQTTET